MRNSKNIVWLASYPKSGNTWYRIFLSNLISNSRMNINNLYETPIASSRYVFDKFTGANSSDLTKDEIEILRPEVYKQISIESTEDTFLKVHDAWRINSVGHEIFPNAITKGVIYIVRNPLDISISFASHSNISIDRSIRNMSNENFEFSGKKESLNIQLNQLISSWSSHVKSWIDKSGLNVHILRYEDMLNDPFETFSLSLNFLGKNYSSYRIQQAIQNSSFKTLKKQELEFGFKEKPLKSKSFFREGNYGYWKSKLSKKQISEIEESHGEVMKRFGYTFLLISSITTKLIFTTFALI